MEKTGKKKYTENLVILDYSSGAVHFYKIDPEAEIDENYISNLGFRTGDYYWMFCKSMKIFKHEGVLI